MPESGLSANLSIPAIPLTPTPGHTGLRSKLPIMAVRSGHPARFEVAPSTPNCRYEA